MKNYKLIPLLAMTALLAGCGVSKGAKAPKFAKLGEEISVFELSEVVASTDFLGPWTNYELEVPSARFVNKQSRQINEKLYSNKKVVETYTYKNSTETSMDLDMKNLRAKMHDAKKEETKYKTKEDENTHASLISHNYGLQFGTSSYGAAEGEEKEYLFGYDLDAKIAHINANVTDYTDEAKLETFLDVALPNTEFSFPYDIASFPIYYESLSDERQQEYKIYQNESIYTIVYDGDYSTAELDPSNNLVSIRRNKVDRKIQIDVTDPSSYKVSSANTTTYRIDYYQFTTFNEQPRNVGDYLQGKEVSYQEINVTAGEVTVEEVDISNFPIQ